MLMCMGYKWEEANAEILSIFRDAGHRQEVMAVLESPYKGGLFPGY